MKTYPWLLIALALGGAGCSFDLGLGGTRGENGEVRFSYSDWQECFLFGCSVDQPMLHGTREVVGISSIDPRTGLTIASSAPDILQVSYEVSRSCCSEDAEGTSCGSLAPGQTCDAEVQESYLAHVSALAPGEADLEVRDAGGELVDWIGLRVEAAARLELGCGLDGNEPPLADLGVGHSCRYHVRAYTAADEELKATHGVLVQIVDADVAVLHEDAFINLFPEDETSLGDGRGIVEGRTPGSTQLLAKTGALQQSIPVTVHE